MVILPNHLYVYQPPRSEIKRCLFIAEHCIVDFVLSKKYENEIYLTNKEVNGHSWAQFSCRLEFCRDPTPEEIEIWEVIKKSI